MSATPPPDYIGTVEAGRRLGLHDSRVRRLILAGRLPATKIGQTWLIRPEDLEHVRHRKPGRPTTKGDA